MRIISRLGKSPHQGSQTGEVSLIFPASAVIAAEATTQTKDQRQKTMKTITLKNGMVIFIEQIAFIHVQPSASNGETLPEIHAHFSAGLTTPKGSRSMRAVISDENGDDFINQLERHGVECTHLRGKIKELKKAA
jgi:hypothetical protein